MIKNYYDWKRDIYNVTISGDELRNAFRSRENYRDFLLKAFGYHLTLEDIQKVENLSQDHAILSQKKGGDNNFSDNLNN